MLVEGGARVQLAGFTRDETKVPDAWSTEVLGRTRDAALGQRALAVVRVLLNPAALRHRVSGCSAVVARNLEMLVLAVVGLALTRDRPPLTYEVLDIHRVMLGSGIKARALRWLERLLMRRVARVVVSSPAFDSAYFGHFHPSGPPRHLIENKILAPRGRSVTSSAPPPPHPWRIGWFGMLRCRKSLEVLTRLVRENPGRIEVDIRGIPSGAVFGKSFEALVADVPGLHFHGRYGSEDLASHYQQVHLVWGIDFYEEGLNSSWLLPNRLYEGSAFGRPLIALRQVETGRWLARWKAGVLIHDVDADLNPFFRALTPATYATLERRAQAVPVEALISDAADCRALVALLMEPGA